MKTLLSWSSGKDSAWSLHILRQDPNIEVVGLVTTLNAAFDRVAMHGVRREILEAQAEAAGLPLHVVELPWPCSNEDYEKRMGAFVSQALAAGVEAMAFGDLYLEDIRKYREDKLSGTGLKPLFPLWLRDTRALADEMIAGGLETWVSVVDQKKLDASFAGRRFDASFLADLPADVDPCGENGEFHSCVTAGPMFSKAVSVETGETVEREGFAFADLKLCH
ncbi:MAG: adenine nucleotide alpha hydrolase [Hyphomicrobiaceae bacterium]|nr:adenine nucleotide alpha hydrolase [Hyphomicrobiaceae bacterium]